MTTQGKNCNCKPPIYVERFTNYPFTVICLDCKGYRKIPKEEWPQ